MRRRLSTKVVLAMLAALDVALVGAYSFAFWMLRAQNLEVAALNAEVDVYTATSIELSDLQSRLAKVQSGVQKIDTYLIGQEGAVDFIGELEGFARGAGLEIKVNTVEAQEIDKDLKGFMEKVLLRIEVQGDWHEVERFVALVETMPQRVSIDSAQIDHIAAENPGEASSWKGSLIVAAFKLK